MKNVYLIILVLILSLNINMLGQQFHKVSIGNAAGFSQVTTNNDTIQATLGQTFASLVIDNMGTSAERTTVGLWSVDRAITGVEEDPADMIGLGNYPNPFTNSTRISFSLDNPSNIELKIYDMSGNLVSNLYSGYVAVGESSFEWDAKTRNNEAAASGTYLYELIVNPINGITTGKKIQARNIMVLVK